MQTATTTLEDICNANLATSRELGALEKRSLSYGYLKLLVKQNFLSHLTMTQSYKTVYFDPLSLCGYTFSQLEVILENV